MKIINNYVLFFSYKDCLSNFYPCEIIYDNKIFKSSEQLFMYLKAIHYKDWKIAENILKTNLPKEAKLYGRLVSNFNQKDWESVREEIMLATLRAKYNSCNEFRQVINQYKDKTFVEASPYDKIWGIVLSIDDKNAINPKCWKGLNLLGKTINKLINSL